MTFEEQLTKAENEPWFMSWLTNTLTLNDHGLEGYASNFITSAFVWPDSPQGINYWSNIHGRDNYEVDHITYAEMFAILRDRYTETNPEYFI